MTIVHDENGYEIDVCESCLERHYSYCEECEEWHHNDRINTAYRDGEMVSVCDDCLQDHYAECEECGEYYHIDEMENDRCENCREDEEAC